jgi:alpha-galactosidase
MGVNALAYRLPQHRCFFLLDADCVPITKATPWSLNGQWLDLLARSGTVLLVSPEPAAIGQEQREAVRRAFELAAAIGNEAIPLDWQECTTPRHWEFHNSSGSIPLTKSFDWCQDSGAWPYDV